VVQLSPTYLVCQKIIEDGKCARCGARPQPVGTMLDTAKGHIIRMFKCECGEQTWASDPK